MPICRFVRVFQQGSVLSANWPIFQCLMGGDERQHGSSLFQSLPSSKRAERAAQTHLSHCSNLSIPASSLRLHCSSVGGFILIFLWLNKPRLKFLAGLRELTQKKPGISGMLQGCDSYLMRCGECVSVSMRRREALVEGSFLNAERAREYLLYSTAVSIPLWVC